MFRFQIPDQPLGCRLGAAVLLASLTGSALALPLAAAAQPVGNPGKTRPTPAQMEKIFPEFRTLQIEDHRARISTMQSAERCLQAAKNATALQACMKQERTAAMSQRQQHLSSVRQLFERNGLPVPERVGADRNNRRLTPNAAPLTAPSSTLPL